MRQPVLRLGFIIYDMKAFGKHKKGSFRLENRQYSVFFCMFSVFWVLTKGFSESNILMYEGNDREFYIFLSNLRDEKIFFGIMTKHEKCDMIMSEQMKYRLRTQLHSWFITSLK